MVAGNTCITAAKADCEETFGLVRKNQSISGGLSNALRFPYAKKYVERLLKEAPSARTDVRRRLAVVTGVYKGCPGYHVAEELAVAANMDVILVGKSVKKLTVAADGIADEAKKRSPASSSSSAKEAKALRLYQVRTNVNTLRSVATAAQEIQQICTDHYQGQLHVLVNLGGVVSDVYSTTEEGVEVNVGRNYLAPRLLADLLLPVLRAAATSDYKPRVVQEASLGHCQGTDFNPNLLRKLPKEGGAPDGTIVRNAVTNDMEYSISENGGLEMYYRSKMALMADTIALAREEPMLAVVSCDPGILTSAVTTSTSSVSPRSLLSRTSSVGGSMGSYLFNLGPSQGARSALRAALDPAFNSTDHTMQYLHCDGNPWVMADPTVGHPQRGGDAPYYGLEEYAEIVRDVGDEISGQLVADKDCEWELCLRSAELSSSSLMLGGSSHHTSTSVLHQNNSHSSLVLHSSQASLLGRSYSSLFSQ